MSTPTSSASTSTSATASASASNTAGQNSPATGSPLLFFVALGFGVVFTNLWIIVGVKYCFRINQRNRQPRPNENGEIDMATMPRPHRRRREKKLMTMDEVNERFPLTKYKAWRTSREKEGLPAEGGIAAPTSRPTSVRDVEGVINPTKETHTHGTTTPKPPFKDVTAKKAEEEGPSMVHDDRRFSEASDVEKGLETTKHKETKTTTLGSELKPSTTVTSAEEEEEEDDHIQTAVPQELLANPGDACAICLETLEDDDDVRGLTCGHAFHASCLDPWLTNRRACCPLCKADYYVPKPRPEGEETAEERSNRRNGQNRTSQMPEQPPAAWSGPRSGNPFRTRMVLPGRFMTPASSTPAQHDRYGFPISRRDRTAQQTTAENNDTSFSQDPNVVQPDVTPAPTSSWSQRLRHPLRREAQPQPAESAPAEVSYSADPSSAPAPIETPSEQPARSGYMRFIPRRTRDQAPEIRVA